jgi:hypothetical protein
MGRQFKFGEDLPLTTSVGCLRIRTIAVDINVAGFAREYSGVTKFYRSRVETTAYSGMSRNSPSPVINYTVTDGVIDDSFARGWDIITAKNGVVTDDLDTETINTTAEVWTPSLITNPTFAVAVTTNPNATTQVETSAANGSWSGTKTVTTVWSDEITEAERVQAYDDAVAAVTFTSTEFSLLTGKTLQPVTFWIDPITGNVSGDVIDYSVGTYTGRPSIAFIEILQLSFDSGPVENSVRQFSSDLDEIVDVPPAGLFGQDSFRDDDKQLFGGWQRIDAHEQFPAETDMSGAAFLFPLSGHVFLEETTGTTTSSAGWVEMGGIGSPTFSPNSFLYSHGPLT